MSKEDLEKQIELLVRDDESNQQTIIKQSEEIKRLKNINEEHRILNGELRKELEVEKDISDGMLKTIDRAKELMNEYKYTKIEEYGKIIEFYKKLEEILKGE